MTAVCGRCAGEGEYLVEGGRCEQCQEEEEGRQLQCGLDLPGGCSCDCAADRGLVQAETGNCVCQQEGTFLPSGPGTACTTCQVEVGRTLQCGLEVAGGCTCDCPAQLQDDGAGGCECEQPGQYQPGPGQDCQQCQVEGTGRELVCGLPVSGGCTCSCAPGLQESEEGDCLAGGPGCDYWDAAAGQCAICDQSAGFALLCDLPGVLGGCVCQPTFRNVRNASDTETSKAAGLASRADICSSLQPLHGEARAGAVRRGLRPVLPADRGREPRNAGGLAADGAGPRLEPGPHLQSV